MKRLILFLALMVALPVAAQDFGHGSRGKYKIVSDTTGVDKSLGRLYFYTGDSTLYLGDGTYLDPLAVKFDSLYTRIMIVRDSVGIGTTAPESDLHIEKDGVGPIVTLTGKTDANADATLLLSRAGATAVQGLKLRYDAATADGYIDNLYNNNNGDIFIRTKTAGTPVVAVTVAGSGVVTFDKNIVVRDSVSIGQATATDNVVPYMRLKGDADSDASAVTSETLTTTLTAGATPTTGSYWDISSTQNAIRISGAQGVKFRYGTTACWTMGNGSGAYNSSNLNLYPGDNDSKYLGASDVAWRGLYLTDILNHGGKGQTAAQIITTANDFTAADSSLKNYLLAGNPRSSYKAGDADSLYITCDNDSARLGSNNPISIYGTTYFWNGISVQSITDRTDYVSQETAKKILRKLDFTQFDGIKNIADSLILPVELRSKSGRDLTRTVSFLLAVIVEQKQRIDAASRRSFLALGLAVIAIAVSFIRRKR